VNAGARRGARLAPSSSPLTDSGRRGVCTRRGMDWLCYRGQGRETHDYAVLSAFSISQFQACRGYTYLL